MRENSNVKCKRKTRNLDSFSVRFVERGRGLKSLKPSLSIYLFDLYTLCTALSFDLHPRTVDKLCLFWFAIFACEYNDSGR